MPRKDTNIEKRAKLIIKYRKMRVRKKEKNEDIIKYSLLKDDARAHFHWTTIVRSLDGGAPANPIHPFPALDSSKEGDGLHAQCIVNCCGWLVK